MKALNVAQVSPIMECLTSAQVSGGYMVWADNGEKCKFPIPLSETRERLYVQPTYKFDYTFDKLCLLFPQSVIEANETTEASWGCGIFVKGDCGFPQLFRSNFDSSD